MEIVNNALRNSETGKLCHIGSLEYLQYISWLIVRTSAHLKRSLSPIVESLVPDLHIGSLQRI